MSTKKNQNLNRMKKKTSQNQIEKQIDVEEDEEMKRSENKNEKKKGKKEEKQQKELKRSEEEQKEEEEWGELESIGEGKNLKLKGEEITIGRSRSCTFRFEEVKALSSIHCKLVKIINRKEPNKFGVLLYDLSSNGIELNGRKVIEDEVIPLRNGDQISLCPKALKSKGMQLNWSFKRLKGKDEDDTWLFENLEDASLSQEENEDGEFLDREGINLEGNDSIEGDEDQKIQQNGEENSNQSSLEDDKERNSIEEENKGDGNKEDKEIEKKKKKPKKVIDMIDEKRLHDFKTRVTKSGVIYISTLPPGIFFLFFFFFFFFFLFFPYFYQNLIIFSFL